MEAIDITSVIESITCPITAEPMKDPVTGSDGQTYERSAIIQALNIKAESPITRQFMTVNDLKVNATIRFLCDKYHEGKCVQATAIEPLKVSTDSIKVNHEISRNTENNVMLTFDIDKNSMPSDLEHLSQDVVLIIDRSGSTNTAVEAKDVNGQKLENGMSILDIVNHSAKTVAKTLDKNSRLSVIIFDNTIQQLFNLKLMTEMNSSDAIRQISSIKPGGQTDIWHALELGITVLNDRTDKSRNGAIMILTDGCPNISPARGEVETLKRLKEKLNFTSPIYTFGFGYHLERGLLYDLAKYGGGGNGHIPDGGMIATVFCHSIASILSTVVVNLQLYIQYNENFNIIDYPPLMGDHDTNIINSQENTNITALVNLGTVQL